MVRTLFCRFSITTRLVRHCCSTNSTHDLSRDYNVRILFDDRPLLQSLVCEPCHKACKALSSLKESITRITNYTCYISHSLTCTNEIVQSNSPLIATPNGTIDDQCYVFLHKRRLGRSSGRVCKVLPFQLKKDQMSYSLMLYLPPSALVALIIILQLTIL